MVYNCNTCNSKSAKEIFQIDKFRVVQCTECDLVYVANPMTLLQTSRHYEDEYYTGANGGASSSCYGQGEQFRMKEASDKLDKIGSVDSLLDVGCGMGFFVKAAKQRGIHAVGIDISPNAVQYGQEQGLDIRQSDLLYLHDFKNETFDVITFWASIEHLYKPKESLEKARRLLRPHGLVVIETGDISSYQARLFKGKWRLVEIDHNYYYSASTIDDLLSLTGFKTVRTDNDGFIEAVLTQLGLKDWALNHFAQSSGDSKERSSSLKERINGLASKLKLGDVMIKYARKKE